MQEKQERAHNHTTIDPAISGLPTAAATALLNNTPEATSTKLPHFQFNKLGTLRDSSNEKDGDLRSPTELSPTAIAKAGS